VTVTRDGRRIPGVYAGRYVTKARQTLLAKMYDD
jgi:hypothetical protein